MSHFLGLAEPVVNVSGTGRKTGYSSFASSDELSVFVHSGMSSEPESSDLRLEPVPDSTTELLTSTFSVTPTAEDARQGPSQQLEGLYKHTQCLINGLPKYLTAEQHARAEALIKSRSNDFCHSEYDTGRTSIVPHCIDTDDKVPYFEQLQHHSTTQLPLIDDHMENMLRYDVVELAGSPWCSNVVMVQKQGGTMQLCHDYRKTNELIKKNKFPLPKIDRPTCLDTLNGSQYFSSCDLCWGYWQTAIYERDCDKTAFVTRKGQWCFKVLSFALCNAPSQFAQIMKLVL